MFESDDNTIFKPKQLLAVLAITILVIIVTGLLSVFIQDKSVALLSESFIIVPALVFAFRQKMPVLKTFRLNPISVQLFLLSLLLAVSIFVISDEIDRIITLIFPMPLEIEIAMKNLVTIDSFREGVILFTAAVLFAGFAEEMLFRGVIQKSFEHYRDPAHAIVITAVLFALIHFNPWTALQITFLGLVLGFITWKSNSIFPAILLHALNNMFSLIMMNMPEEQLDWYCSPQHVKLSWFLLAVIVFSAGFYMFNKICNEQSSNLK